ncbi:MAG: LTA synthase family protein [bacterium]|nr:LTA synthase family protein [bacterium]
MKKGKVLWKILSKILLLFVIFLLLLLWRSADWFLDNFHEVDFSIALYQLFSPLKGTEAGVLSDYINQCLYPMTFFAVAGVVIYTLYDMMAGQIFLKMDLRIGTRTLHIGGGAKRKYAQLRKLIVLWLVIGILCAGVGNRAAAVGIPEYVQSVTNVSTIFESEYINPDDVAIVFPEKKRNLIVLYMESMESTYASVQEGGGKPINYIPELTDLAKENVSFSDDGDLGGAGAASQTGWTMGGLFSSITGVPYKLPIDGNEAGEYESFAPGLKGLGEVLSENGYQNYFMCGSEAVFGGRKAFYEQHGNYRIFDYITAKEDGIIPEDYHVYWGMEDAKLYEYAKRQLTEIAAQSEPFNFMMLTVDTHPGDGYLCDLCDDTYANQYENVVACASRQAAQFVDWISKQAWYEDTTIVITGDHLSMKTDFWEDIGEYQRRIYNCFINLPQGCQARQTTDREFSILDMFPTMLAAVGAEVEGDRLALGTNLFSEEKTLPEQMGFGEFNRELNLYSNYYYLNFIVGSKSQA